MRLAAHIVDSVFTIRRKECPVALDAGHVEGILSGVSANSMLVP